MASSKDRQRKLARAKFDRQMARRAERERRRRRVLSGVAAGVAIVVAVGGGLLISGVFDKDDDTPAADSSPCAWTPQNNDTNTDLTEVGTPPTNGFPTTGTRPMTITTDQGTPIVVSLDLADAPCSGESMTYLAGKKFFDNTTCYEVTSYGALHCGDPKATGHGGPTYAVFSENLPLAADPSASPAATPAKPLYPKGTVALIGDPPGTNGSQFLIFTKDYTPATPEYPIIGQVTAGADTVEKISKIPLIDAGDGENTKPKTAVKVTSITVGDPSTTGDNPSAAPSASQS